jgi:tripartite-type tricarboxylate transporter receptor subunit TctC
MKTLLLAAALAVIGVGDAAAQTYPARPITIIAPFPPGGPSDAVARILSGPLEAALGQPVVIENIGGAGGTLGVGRVTRAEPDGYTLLIGQWGTQVVNPVTYKLDYDAVNDLAPIALLANTPQLIIARNGFPASDVHELIAWLKANPDKAQAATVGAAGGAQVAGMYFQKVTGTNFGFVPYRGGAPAMQDLMAGRVDLMFDQAANAITQVRAGTIKAYAVMTRSAGTWRPTSRPSTSRALPACTFPIGTGCSRRRARRWTSSPRSMPQWWPRSPIRRSSNVSPPKARTSGRAISRARKRSPRSTAKWWPIIKAEGLKAE